MSLKARQVVNPWTPVATVAELKRAVARPGSAVVSIENHHIGGNTGNIFIPGAERGGSTKVRGEAVLLDGTVKGPWVFGFPKASEFTALPDGTWRYDNTAMRGHAIYAVFPSEELARAWVEEHRGELVDRRAELVEEQVRAQEQRQREEEEKRRKHFEEVQAERAKRKEEYGKNPKVCSSGCGRYARFESSLCAECRDAEKEEWEEMARQRKKDTAEREKDTRRLKTALSKIGRQRVTIQLPQWGRQENVIVFVNNNGQCGYLSGRQRRNGVALNPSEVIVLDKTGEVVFCGTRMVRSYAHIVADKYGLTVEEAETFIRLQDGEL
jgi:hypothetical protein